LDDPESVPVATHPKMEGYHNFLEKNLTVEGHGSVVSMPALYSKSLEFCFQAGEKASLIKILCELYQCK
jgi:hypothetical protein